MHNWHIYLLGIGLGVFRIMVRVRVRIRGRIRVRVRIFLNVFRGSTPLTVWCDCASVPLDQTPPSAKRVRVRFGLD